MPKEKINPAPRELNFYGEGKAFDIMLGYAITSLRNPRPDYEFARGEKIYANCQDDGEKIPVVVITNELKKLRDFSTPQLAMDGFFSAEGAVDGMKIYPGYEKININSPLKAITFVQEESYNSLPKATRAWASRQQSFDDIVGHPKLRQLFLPTMCFHLASTGGTLYNWAYFLKDSEIISTGEFKHMLEFAQGSEAFKDARTLTAILQEPDGELFKKVILGLYY